MLTIEELSALKEEVNNLTTKYISLLDDVPIERVTPSDAEQVLRILYPGDLTEFEAAKEDIANWIASLEMDSSFKTVSLKEALAFFTPDSYPDLIQSLKLDIARLERARTRGVMGSLVSFVEPIGNIPTEDFATPPFKDIPLDHIVLLKLKPFESKANEDHFYRCISRLDQIPGVNTVRFGPVRCDLYPGMTDRTSGYTHILFINVANGAALQRYDIHPIHQHTKFDVISTFAAAPSMAVDFFSMIPRL